MNLAKINYETVLSTEKLVHYPSIRLDAYIIMPIMPKIMLAYAYTV